MTSGLLAEIKEYALVLEKKLLWAQHHESESSHDAVIDSKKFIRSINRAKIGLDIFQVKFIDYIYRVIIN